MSSSGSARYDVELEEALIDLGRHYPYPRTPEVAPSVMSRLEGTGQRSPGISNRLSRRRTAVLGALAALLLLAGATLAASPAARAAVAEWLGIPGVRIITGSDSLPTGRLGRTLDLGRRVTLATAEERVRFHVLLPTSPDLRHPDEIYLASSPPGGSISLLYRARSGLPATHDTGVGLLLTEFQATSGQVFFGKTVGWRSIPEGIRVGTGRGYWVKGDHLTSVYRTIDGRRVWSNVVVAGNTLIWEHHGLTLRLESALSERAALRIATAMR